MILYMFILSGSSKTVSGMQSPFTGFHTPKVAYTNRSVHGHSIGHYAGELVKHFRNANSSYRYAITLSNRACQIIDGHNVVYSVPVIKDDSTSIRNLYLMLYASGYKVETFLSKLQANEFGADFNGNGMATPPVYSERSNVFAFAVARK
jgi:hypothetical protein